MLAASQRWDSSCEREVADASAPPVTSGSPLLGGRIPLALSLGMDISQALGAGLVRRGLGTIAHAAPRELSLGAATPDDTGANSFIGRVSRSHRLGAQHVLDRNHLQQKKRTEKTSCRGAIKSRQPCAIKSGIMKLKVGSD